MSIIYKLLIYLITKWITNMNGTKSEIYGENQPNLTRKRQMIFINPHN